MSEITIKTKTLSKRQARKLLMKLFDVCGKFVTNPYEAMIVIDEKKFCVAV